MVTVTSEKLGENPVTYTDVVRQEPANMQLTVPPYPTTAPRVATTDTVPHAPGKAIVVLKATFDGAVWLVRSQVGSLVVSAAAAFYCPAYSAMIVRAGFNPTFNLATRLGFSFLPQSGAMGLAARVAPGLVNKYVRWAMREHATQFAMVYGRQIMGLLGYGAAQVITQGPNALKITYNGVTSVPRTLSTAGSAAATAVGTVATSVVNVARTAANTTAVASGATHSVASSVVSTIAARISYLSYWFSKRTVDPVVSAAFVANQYICTEVTLTAASTDAFDLQDESSVRPLTTLQWTHVQRNHDADVGADVDADANVGADADVGADVLSIEQYRKLGHE